MLQAVTEMRNHIISTICMVHACFRYIRHALYRMWYHKKHCLSVAPFASAVRSPCDATQMWQVRQLQMVWLAAASNIPRESPADEGHPLTQGTCLPSQHGQEGLAWPRPFQHRLYLHLLFVAGDLADGLRPSLFSCQTPVGLQAWAAGPATVG